MTAVCFGWVLEYIDTENKAFNHCAGKRADHCLQAADFEFAVLRPFDRKLLPCPGNFTNPEGIFHAGQHRK